MKKIVIVSGLIAGGINIIGWWVMNLIWGQPTDGESFDMTQGMIIGFAAMILALSTVFFGIKAYRDRERGGIISFGKAFLTGLYIVLIASAIYVIGWMIYYPNFMADFPEQYYEYQVQLLEKEGLPPAELETQKSQLRLEMENYKNPFVMAAYTFMEIFPVGLIIALISALILKKKPSQVKPQTA